MDFTVLYIQLNTILYFVYLQDCEPGRGGPGPAWQRQEAAAGRREVPARVRRGAPGQRGRRAPHRTQPPAGVATGRCRIHTLKSIYLSERLRDTNASWLLLDELAS